MSESYTRDISLIISKLLTINNLIKLYTLILYLLSADPMITFMFGTLLLITNIIFKICYLIRTFLTPLSYLLLYCKINTSTTIVTYFYINYSKTTYQTNNNLYSNHLKTFIIHILFNWKKYDSYKNA